MPTQASRFYTVLLSTLALVATLILAIGGRPAPAPVAHAGYTPAAVDPLVLSTPRDFELPGTQPVTLAHTLLPPRNCATCHADYAAVTGQPPETETWSAWSGSMMAQAGRDPVFFAALDIANAGAAGSGEFCLRCHLPRGWLEGRSTPADGSAMTADDQEGVQCSVCHRLVDPDHGPENPARDAQILAALEEPVLFPGTASMVVDPEDYRRGPFDVAAELDGFDPHLPAGAQGTLVSPFHRESDFCGTCHDITNPLFTWDEEAQEYVPNPLDQPGDLSSGFPIERTYSEWRQSAFNSSPGVYAPDLGGNKDFVSTCQDCHMRDVTGAGGAFFGSRTIIRQDMPLHDLTGANTWVPQIIPDHPAFTALFEDEPERAEALAAGIERARAMLRKAATLVVYRQGDELVVTVYNRAGHKLPTGYVEGRRMWLQVMGYSDQGALVYSSGAYDQTAAELSGYGQDPTLKVYEAHHGLSVSWAEQLGLEAGPSFHFALNNMIVTDNRIPPRGYDFAAFNAIQAAPYTDGQPDPQRYRQGQFWDTTRYELPPSVTHGVVRLLYQTASREYIEFLRANNPFEGENNGEILYRLWDESGRSRPEIMAEQTFSQQTMRQFLPAVQGS